MSLKVELNSSIPSSPKGPPLNKSPSLVTFPNPVDAKIKAKATKSSCCSSLKRIFLSCMNCFSSKDKKHEAAAKRIIKSQKEIARLHTSKEYVPRKSRSRRPLKVEAKFFSSKNALRRKHLLSEKQVAKKAAGLGIPSIQNLTIQGIGSLVPKRFENNKIIDNEILPTSYIAAHPKDPANNHLANTFSLLVDGKERAIIRTAKIDTLQKAEDFAALLQSIRNKIAEDSGKDDFVLRVVSNQLNSYEIEKTAIENQHWLLERININLKGTVEIVHFNTPVIGFYDLAKSLKKVPLSQRVLFRNSEDRSRMQNLEGWGTYFTWIAEEFPDLQKQSKTIKKSVDRIRNSNPKNLAKSRAKLRRQLIQLHQELIKGGESFKQHKQVCLFTQILASQLKIKGAVLERNHELILLHMLNTEMQVTGQVNCKSGLDRTGGIHSLMVSLEAVSSTLGSDAACAMALNWTSLALRLNAASLKKHGTKTLLKSLPEEEAEQFYAAMEFRKTFLSNLMRIGLPITAINTGYVGFKWQSGVYLNIVENLVPLNFLPPNVYIKKNDKRIIIPLVKYSKQGKPLGLTKQGRALLTRLSEMRGA